MIINENETKESEEKKENNKIKRRIRYGIWPLLISLAFLIVFSDMRAEAMCMPEMANNVFLADQDDGEDGWRQIDGLWYYYIDGSRALDTILEIDGDYYYFDWVGIMSHYGFHKMSIEGVEQTIYAKTDGKLARNEWIKGSWKDYYYFSDDLTMVSNTIYTIDGEQYGFMEDGRNWRNISFRLKDTDGEYYYYRAKKGGVLYKDEWYLQLGEKTSFYGEDCRAVTGLTEVDGEKYIFSDSGYLCKNQISEIDGVWYISDAEGKIYEIAADDIWFEISGYWYYAENGVPVVGRTMQIAEKYYYFDRYGRMVVNNLCIFEDETYRANENGELYISSWYENGDGRREYCQSDGTRVENKMLSLDGERYIFDWGGKLVTNYLYKYDGVIYLCDAEGHVSENVKDGWTVFDDGKRFMYREDSW